MLYAGVSLQDRCCGWLWTSDRAVIPCVVEHGQQLAMRFDCFDRCGIVSQLLWCVHWHWWIKYWPLHPRGASQVSYLIFRCSSILAWIGSRDLWGTMSEDTPRAASPMHPWWGGLRRKERTQVRETWMEFKRLGMHPRWTRRRQVVRTEYVPVKWHGDHCESKMSRSLIPALPVLLWPSLLSQMASMSDGSSFITRLLESACFPSNGSTDSGVCETGVCWNAGLIAGRGAARSWLWMETWDGDVSKRPTVKKHKQSSRQTGRSSWHKVIAQAQPLTTTTTTTHYID